MTATMLRTNTSVLLQAATDQLEFQNRSAPKAWVKEYPEVCTYGKHLPEEPPRDPDSYYQDTNLVWVGRPGTSESVGAWITMVTQLFASQNPTTVFTGRPTDDKQYDLTLYAAPFRDNEQTNDRQYLAAASITNAWGRETLLAGGMTNCSGEGSRAYRTVLEFVTALANYRDIQVREIEISMAQHDELLRWHNEAVTEYLALKRGNDDTE